jgi:DNA-binding GntR family transcriptional regulator
MARKTLKRRTRPPAARKAVQHRVAADERIYSAICDAILERRMPPGTRLQEIQLGEFFGVSRTIAHRALLRLAHEGIVSLRPKRVAVVARPSIQETRSVFEARRAVESAIVPLVMRSAANGLADKLHAMVQAENAAYARGDRAAGTRLSVAFHLHLADLASNPVLAKYVRELVLRTSLIVALYESPSRAAHPHLEHADIVEKIAAGNEKAAVRAMVDHLEQLEANLELRESEAAPTLAAIFGSATVPTGRPSAPAFAVSEPE